MQAGGLSVSRCPSSEIRKPDTSMHVSDSMPCSLPIDEQKAGDVQLHYGDGPVGPGQSAENPAGVSAEFDSGMPGADTLAIIGLPSFRT